MKKLLLATALIAAPVVAQAQVTSMPGFYIGGEGGINWMLNTNTNIYTNTNTDTNINTNTNTNTDTNKRYYSII